MAMLYDLMCCPAPPLSTLQGEQQICGIHMEEINYCGVHWPLGTHMQGVCGAIRLCELPTCHLWRTVVWIEFERMRRNTPPFSVSKSLRQDGRGYTGEQPCYDEQRTCQQVSSWACSIVIIQESINGAASFVLAIGRTLLLMPFSASSLAECACIYVRRHLPQPCSRGCLFGCCSCLLHRFTTTRIHREKHEQCLTKCVRSGCVCSAQNHGSHLFC